MKQPRLTATLAVLIAAHAHCIGQADLMFDGGIPLQGAGQALPLGWAGGLNAVQVSSIDLDQDGSKDLFLFDRSGNAVITLLNTGAPGTVSYTLTRAYDLVHPFPILHDWVLLRDYNGDGKEDIFTYSQAGFAVYRNVGTPSGPAFDLVTSQVMSNYVTTSGNPIIANLFVSQVDLPGIVDVDGDGDLDVLTFSLLGTYVEYHKNLSMELYGVPDSLKFEVRNRCWGYFAESSMDNSVTLNAPCSFNVPNPEIGTGGAGIWRLPIGEDGGPKAHSGSALCPLDLNGDDVMDLLLGDVSYNNVVALYNGGSTSQALMTQEDTLFPSANVSVDLAVFPAGFHVDVDNDGKRDLVVSPNLTSLSENRHSMWFYRNTGTDAVPVFNFEQNDLLQDLMIDLGEGAYPVPFDHDGDGLMDLVVADHGYFQPDGTYLGKMALLRNVGTPTSPAFDLVNEDYMSLSTSGIGLSMYPAFGDVDGDGDLDLYVGDLQGRLHFFRNVATGSEAQFVLEVPNITDTSGEIIDVGQFATPQFHDLDGDGLIDLLIGERNGNLNHYRNTGNTTNPSWSLITDALGGVSTVEWWNITGHSVPWMFTSDQGDRQMVLGSESGWLYHYGDIDDNIDGPWTLLDSAFLGVRDGIRTAPCLYDFTGDGKVDMVLGNYRGGLSFWRSDPVNSTGVPRASQQESFGIQPNPASGRVALTLKEFPLPGARWVFHDALGHEVLAVPATDRLTQVDLQTLAAGLYVVRLEGSHPLAGQRVVVDRH